MGYLQSSRAIQFSYNVCATEKPSRQKKSPYLNVYWDNYFDLRCKEQKFIQTVLTENIKYLILNLEHKQHRQIDI